MIILGYVHGGMLHAEFAKSVQNFVLDDKKVLTGRNLVGGSCDVRGLYVADSRNAVCKRFLDARYPTGEQPQWLLFLDTDIIFSTQQAYDLYDAAVAKGPCIMGGQYFGYLENRVTSVWRMIHKGGALENKWGTLGSLTTNTITSVGAVGMGFTIVHREVLEAFPDTGDTWRWFAHDKWWTGERLGEDLTFCHRATKLGYTTWGNSHITVGHSKVGVITLDHFFQDQKVHNEAIASSKNSETYHPAN